MDELLPMRMLSENRGPRVSPGSFSYLPLSIWSQNLLEQARWGRPAPPEGTQGQRTTPLPCLGLGT